MKKVRKGEFFCEDCGKFENYPEVHICYPDGNKYDYDSQHKVFKLKFTNKPTSASKLQNENSKS